MKKRTRKEKIELGKNDVSAMVIRDEKGNILFDGRRIVNGKYIPDPPKKPDGD